MMRREDLLRTTLPSIFLALAACGGAASDAAPPASAPAPSAAPAASASAAADPAATPVATPPGMKLVEIPKVGLVGFATTEGTVKEDKLVTAGGFIAQVHPPVDMDPTTIEKGRSEAGTLLTDPKIKDEKLPDGWMVTADSAKNFYGFVYRTFKGKPIVCETIDLDAKSRDAAMAFCKTLHVK